MLWAAARVSITDFYGLSGMGFYISIVYRTTVRTTPSQQAKPPKCQGSFQLLQRNGAKTCKRCWTSSASSAASYLARISMRHCHITLASGIGRKTKQRETEKAESIPCNGNVRGPENTASMTDQAYKAYKAYKAYVWSYGLFDTRYRYSNQKGSRGHISLPRPQS